MNTFSAPAQKLLLATVLLLVLLALAAATRIGAATAARVLLGVVVLGAAVAYWRMATRRSQVELAPARLKVLARTGLTSRSGLALVEAEGQTFLIAHGEGFAEIQPMTPRAGGFHLPPQRGDPS